MAIRINKELCPQNHHCPLLVECPMQAMTQQGFELPVINTQECIECGKCIIMCPKGAPYQETDAQ